MHHGVPFAGGSLWLRGFHSCQHPSAGKQFRVRSNTSSEEGTYGRHDWYDNTAREVQSHLVPPMQMRSSEEPLDVHVRICSHGYTMDMVLQKRTGTDTEPRLEHLCKICKTTQIKHIEKTCRTHISSILQSTTPDLRPTTHTSSAIQTADVQAPRAP